MHGARARGRGGERAHVRIAAVDKGGRGGARAARARRHCGGAGCAGRVRRGAGCGGRADSGMRRDSRGIARFGWCALRARTRVAVLTVVGVTRGGVS